MTKQGHGRYVGPIKKLKGESASLEQTAVGFYKAQFDNRELGAEWAFSWTEHRASHFTVWWWCDDAKV